MRILADLASREGKAKSLIVVIEPKPKMEGN